MADEFYHASPDAEYDRHCTNIGDFWVYTDKEPLSDDSVLKKTLVRFCERGHPEDLVKKFGELTLKPTDSDRGAFGMPGLGIGRVMEVPEARNPQYEMLVSEGGISIDYGEVGEDVDAGTDDARYILFKVLPGLLSNFLKKNAKYALAQDIDLGLKGIVPDVNRKASVIINRLWFGGGMVDEGLEEVIDDLIGHLLLMRAKMRTLDGEE